MLFLKALLPPQGLHGVAAITSSLCNAIGAMPRARKRCNPLPLHHDGPILHAIGMRERARRLCIAKRCAGTRNATS
jgi:hypothetical protein